MPTYTENYALHQWEDTDDFLRTDFNEDFSKIDTALEGLQGDNEALSESTSTAIANLNTTTQNNAYNIYNLMLQNYYDGKYTSYKSAMIFDGFADESNIASKSAALVPSTGNNRLVLSGTSQSTITNSSSGSSASIMYSRSMLSSYEVTGTGYISGISLYVVGSSISSRTLTYSITVNGVAIISDGTGTATFSTSDGYSSTVSTAPVYVTPGDLLSITVKLGSSTPNAYETSSDLIAGKIYFSGTSGSTATLTSVSFDVPESSKTMAWVRHANGTATMTVGGTSLTSVSTTSTIDVLGNSCTETAFELDAATASGSKAVAITLARGSASTVTLYDYGVVLL